MSFKRWEGTHRPVHSEKASRRLRLVADQDAPAAARRAVQGMANGYAGESLADAELLVSELVTNAVRHGGGDAVDVAFWLDDGTLDVTVWDGGTGFVARERPAQSPPAEGGLGLELVDTVADGWGASDDAPGCAWFRLAMRSNGKRPALEGLELAGAGAPELLDIRRLIASLTQYAVVAFDRQGRVASWSPGAEKLTGYTADDFLGRPLARLFEPDAARPLDSGLEDAAAGFEVQLECWLVRKDGSRVWASTAIATMRDGAGNLRAYSAVISDHSAGKQSDDRHERIVAELRELSLTDRLTRLPNRRAWREGLDRELVRARRDGQELAIAMLELRGTLDGDGLHQRLAQDWSLPLRATDMLARYGEDEFALLLPHCNSADAFGVVTRLQAATPAGVGSTAGIATSDGSDSAESVASRADAALGEAKRRRSDAVLAEPA